MHGVMEVHTSQESMRHLSSISLVGQSIQTLRHNVNLSFEGLYERQHSQKCYYYKTIN